MMNLRPKIAPVMAGGIDTLEQIVAKCEGDLQNHTEGSMAISSSRNEQARYLGELFAEPRN